MTLSCPTPILQKDCERPTSQPPVDALAGSAVQSHQGLVLCILKQDASLNDALGLGSTDIIRVLYSKKLGCISSPVGTGWFQSHHRMQYSLDWIRVAFLLNGKSPKPKLFLVFGIHFSTEPWLGGQFDCKLPFSISDTQKQIRKIIRNMSFSSLPRCIHPIRTAACSQSGSRPSATQQQVQDRARPW